MRKFISKLEGVPLTLQQWVAGIFGILFIRFLLEQLSSPLPPGLLIIETRLHHCFSFLAIGLSLGACVMCFLPKKALGIGKLIMFGMIITWLPPIADLIHSWGRGSHIDYLTGTPKEMIRNYFLFFGPFEERGITFGIKLEIFIILCVIFYYIKYHTGSLWKACLCVWVAYSVTFFNFAFSSFVVWGNDIFLGKFSWDSNVKDELGYLGEWATLSARNFNFLMPPFSFSAVNDVSFSMMYYVFLIGLAAFFFGCYDKKKLTAVLKNSRWERVLHYGLMIGLGMMLAMRLANGSYENNVFNFLYLCVLFLTFYFAWMFAVGVNDVEDVAIDKVSNPRRPFVAGQLSMEDMRATNFFFLMSTLIGGYLLGVPTFFFVLTFTFAYYIYSAPPLKLKRAPILAPFLISIACFSACMAGFLTLSPTRIIAEFPLKWALLLLAIFTLAANVKDIKDIAGDREAGILTLPVIFGEKRGRMLIGGLVAISFLLMPTILKNMILFNIAIFFALGSYFWITSEKYKEWVLFVGYYIYLGIVFYLF